MPKFEGGGNIEESGENKAAELKERIERVHEVSDYIKKVEGEGEKPSQEEIKRQKETLKEMISNGLEEGVLLSPDYRFPIEIAPDSLTPRLKEYLLWNVENGSAESWKDLEGLNLSEDDFGGPETKAGWRKDSHLMIDNSGSISVMMQSKFIIPEGTNEAKHWGEKDFNWGKRPRLGKSHFDYHDGPDWLKEMFDKHWEAWRTAAKAYYTEKENASYHIGPHFE